MGLRAIGLAVLALQTFVVLARHARAMQDACSYADGRRSFTRWADVVKTSLLFFNAYVLVVNVRCCRSALLLTPTRIVCARTRAQLQALLRHSLGLRSLAEQRHVQAVMRIGGCLSDSFAPVRDLHAAYDTLPCTHRERSALLCRCTVWSSRSLAGCETYRG